MMVKSLFFFKKEKKIEKLFYLIQETFSGNVGLAISQALILTGMVQYGVRQSAESAQLMTSVERVLQYTDLPQEISPKENPPPSWPQKGHVQFQDMTLKYDPSLPAVLKNLNVEIQPGWKVGVVGRTGNIFSLISLSPSQ